MKQISKTTVISLFMFLIIISHTTSARLLSTNQGGNTEIQHRELKSSVEDDFSSLMGLEECGDKDEECLKRRMTAEAHLDYIYTQRHKKP